MTIPDNAIILYKSSDGKTALDVHLDHDTVWLTQKQMADLFSKDVRTVNEHLRNIFREGELDESSVIRKFRITAADGKIYDTTHYNLDIIISVGYRVKSQQGTQSSKTTPSAMATNGSEPRCSSTSSARTAFSTAPTGASAWPTTPWWP